jgi:hypothetical protein
MGMANTSRPIRASKYIVANCRVHEAHATSELLSRVGLDLDPRRRADAHEPEILLEHVSFHPQFTQVGESVQPHPLHNSLTFHDVLLQHDARERCCERQRLGDESGLFDPSDLLIGNVPIRESPPSCLEHRLGAAPRLASPGAIGHAHRRQQLLLCGDEHRAVDGQQRLAPPHRFTGVVDEQLLHETVDLQGDVRDLGLGRLDPPHGAYRAVKRLPLNCRVPHADGSFLVGREVDGLA